MYMEIEGQLVGMGSFLLPCWSKNQTQILKLGVKHLFDESCVQFILPLCFVLFLFFETGFLCVTASLAVLKLAMQTRLTLKS